MQSLLRFNRFVVLFAAILLALAASLLPGFLRGSESRSQLHPIVGLWRTNGPSNLLFDYRADGTVILLEETQSFQMFHYQLHENSEVFLYDGMGRRQVYRYEIGGDEMSYYLAGPEVEKPIYTFRRE